jgi:hypothetical protein
MEVRESGLAAVLSTCPWLAGLRTLHLYSFGPLIGADEVVRLADLAGLQDLCELSLNTATLHPTSCSAISAASFACNLRQLTLARCFLDAEKLSALLVPAFAPRLRSLCLREASLTRTEIEILARWPGLAKVQKLTLDSNQIGDAGLTALVRSGHLGELRELSLQHCDLTSHGLKALASGTLSKLKSLNVSYNDRIADAGLLAVCRSESLSSLRQLQRQLSGGVRNNLRGDTQAELYARFGGTW